MMADTPETPVAPEQGGGMKEVCVPISSLAQSGEGDTMETPQEGDRVSFSVEGNVSRVDAQNAYVTMDTVNGEKLPEGEAEPPDEESALRDSAGQMDEGQAYA